MHRILNRRIFLVSLILAAASFAQPALADGVGISVDAVDVSQFPQVRVYVSVANNGTTLTGLDAQAFQVQEDGKPVDNLAVEPIGESGDPIATAVIVDVSGTMADLQKLDRTVEAADAFVDQLGAGERATLVSFSSRVTVVQDYTDSKAALKTALDSLSAKGNRVLYDAVTQTARRQGAQTQQRRKPIVLLTDGEDSGSTETLETSLAAATAAATPIYAIGLGSDVKKEVLDQLATRTGGQAVYVADPAGLTTVFLSIGDQLRRQYVLRYTSKLTADTSSHGLAIGVSALNQQVTGLQSFTIPASAATATVPTAVVAAAYTAVIPTSIPPPNTSATAPAATTTAEPVAAAVVPESSVSGVAIGVAILVFVLAFLGILWLVTRPRPAKPAPVVVRAPVPPPSDMTEIVGGAPRSDPDATTVRQAADATMLSASPPKRRPPARLMIARRGEESQVNLDQPEAIIGRDDDVAISIKDALASRKHAKIVFEGEQYWIQDLDSLNGTQVNGEKVTRRQLANKDHIAIGETVLTFVLDSQ